ncbi:DUF3168 domain-containing protein [Enterovirga aerilata]|uniref:DUF3168 domain-containing protein n=1 Tax=Enterovirga aerilata TaxID=2730920 RepID=A0A849IGH9_9HYPH|nr:DUF3168 domain-containing protein [Enterovirga sp. DB1703]NNM75057.1 DUF3168 domain-containing protein [Enterovirga sp. DB1703]
MSAELALQGAVVTALKAASTVTAVVGQRVYDRVPAAAPMPYVHFRSVQAVDDGSDQIDALEVYVDLDVWSTAVGKPEAARAAEAVRRALHHQALTLAEPWGLLEIEHRDTNIGDEDGLLVRARMTFRALVERV